MMSIMKKIMKKGLNIQEKGSKEKIEWEKWKKKSIKRKRNLMKVKKQNKKKTFNDKNHRMEWVKKKKDINNRMSLEDSMDKEQIKEQKKGDRKWNFFHLLFLLGLIIPGLFCGI